MQLPINNRIRAQYTIPKEIIERSHMPDDLVEEMNRQVMTRIANELLIHKPDIIEQSTVKFSDDPLAYAPEYHSLKAEVFVFTREELVDLIRRIQIETSTQIREQMTISNWKK